MVNPGEVALVRKLVAALLAAGLTAAEIGLSSPYRAQVRPADLTAARLIVPTVAAWQGRCTHGV